MDEHRFEFTVMVDGNEDAVVVQEYFEKLKVVFTEIVSLAAWGFDTPIVIAKSHMEMGE